jgi:hypothetical protein
MGIAEEFTSYEKALSALKVQKARMDNKSQHLQEAVEAKINHYNDFFQVNTIYEVKAFIASTIDARLVDSELINTFREQTDELAEYINRLHEEKNNTDELQGLVNALGKRVETLEQENINLRKKNKKK